MANSRYDFHKEEERLTDPRFNRDTYVIVRIDGHKFHEFSAEHHFDKPNDKRALDLMIDAAKQVMKTYKGHIPLAYGHSDEFSFLIRSSSTILSRRVFKITSMIPVIFATYYNSNWDRYFQDPDRGEITKKKYDAWFDARPKEYANYKSVIDYFRWRQVDCHINNLYNTTLHAITGRYVRHELLPCSNTLSHSRDQILDNDDSDSNVPLALKRTPISDWISDKSKFLPAKEATQRLNGTVSSEKHDIMFLEYKINYNNELEQFKKGTIVVDSHIESKDASSIKHHHKDLIRSSEFWDNNRHIFDDYVSCPPAR